MSKYQQRRTIVEKNAFNFKADMANNSKVTKVT